MYSIQWNDGWKDGYNKMATSTALDMLRDNKPMEEIVKYSHLPEAKILELAQQIQK